MDSEEIVKDLENREKAKDPRNKEFWEKNLEILENNKKAFENNIIETNFLIEAYSKKIETFK